MRKRKNLPALLTACALSLGLLAGCGGEAGQPSAPPAETTPAAQTETPAPEASPSSAPETRTVTDMDGVEVTVPSEITSYFNGYPVSNGVMVLLGVEEAQNYYLERVTSGNWGWLRVFNPLINEKTIIGDDAYATAEEVLNTDAQVVILSNADTAATYREAGINVFSVSAGNTIPGFWESIRVTAQLFGGEAEERAEAYIQYAQDTMDMVEERLADVPEEERPTVYYIGRTTPYTTSPGGNYTEEYVVAGGGVLCTSGVIDSREITAEQLLELDPDYIFVGTNNRAAGYEALMADEALTGLSALKNGRVYTTPQGTLPWDTLGPEIAMMPVFVGKTLYPDRFEDIDLKELMTEFYKTFYDYDLPGEYAELMLAGAMGPEGQG